MIPPRRSHGPSPDAAAAPSAQFSPSVPSPPLSPAAARPWDDFLVGPENELAFAGARALVRGEREGLSPLLVHGPSGVGKSRLLEGLAAEWRRRHPSSPVVHVRGAEYVEACVDAARRGDRSAWSALHARFRAVGLLVLEDIEQLAQVTVAQDDLIHTLDALDGLGAVAAVSARSAPSQWPRAGWSGHLVNRLLGGFVVRIDPPGLAARRRYLLDRARSRGLVLDEEAVESLAAAADGYAPLEGWLAQLALQSRPVVRPGPRRAADPAPPPPPAVMDLPAVDALLGEETALAAARPTVAQVARAVAVRFEVRLPALRGPARSSSLVRARHLAMYLARRHTGLSFAAIGTYFGRRDAASVRHGCKSTEARLAADPALAAAVASFPWART